MSVITRVTRGRLGRMAHRGRRDRRRSGPLRAFVTRQSRSGVHHRLVGAMAVDAGRALQEQLPATDVQPAIIVISRADNGALTDADRAAVTDRSAELGRVAVSGQVAPPQVSPDGTVALVAVPLSTAGGQDQVVKAVDQLRAALDDVPDTLTVEVTGGPAFTAESPRSSKAPVGWLAGRGPGTPGRYGGPPVLHPRTPDAQGDSPARPRRFTPPCSTSCCPRPGTTSSSTRTTQSEPIAVSSSADCDRCADCRPIGQPR
jgi:hypothetical protein